MKRSRDEGFLQYVLDQLNGFPGLESRPMFGGHGLYQGAIFFAIVHRGRLFFRVDDVGRAEYEARGMKAFHPGPGQKLGRYYEVPADVLEDPPQVMRWARRAVASRPATAASRPR